MIESRKTIHLMVETNQPEQSVEHVYLRRGSRCPNCEEGILDFNGLLDLECSLCGYSLVEGAGCS